MLINLKDFYNQYESDYFVDMPQEVVDVLLESKRNELSYLRRKYRHQAQYSLDAYDGIENTILNTTPLLDEFVEQAITNEQLYFAIATLPKKQAKRIYARYFLGLNNSSIARAEGVSESAVRKSIAQAFIILEKYLKNFSK